MMDTYIINSGRMQRGDAVPETFLYGREACEMIRRRLVDEATMKAYRSGAFLKKRAMYGEEYALQWEAHAKHDHQIAWDMTRDYRPAARPHSEAGE